MPEVKAMLDNSVENIVESKREKTEAGWGHRAETKELRKDAEIDPLTGLDNRRTFEKYITKKQKAIRVEDTNLAGFEKGVTSEKREKLLNMFIIDLDKFKNVNDIYGHDVGDKVLVQVSHAMREEIRKSNDVIARWGGEEFIVAVEDNNNNAVEIAERLRQVVENLDIKHDGQKIPVTVSIGVSPYFENTQDMYEIADKAMYIAKGDRINVQKEASNIYNELPVDEVFRNQVWYFDKELDKYLKYEQKNIK